jgi:hypothetical protein
MGEDAPTVPDTIRNKRIDWDELFASQPADSFYSSDSEIENAQDTPVPLPQKGTEKLLRQMKETLGTEAHSAVGKQRRFAWHWLWFAPLCAAVLILIEGHTISYAIQLAKLARLRWTWLGLFSPSTYFCTFVTLASIWIPSQWAWILSFVIVSSEIESVGKRWLYALLLVVGVFLLPFVTDALIWGSFPFTVNRDGTGLIRLIPFIPWPSLPYGQL